MQRKRLVRLSIILSMALVVLGAEIAARLFWRDAPQDARPINTLQFVRAPGETAAFTMKPASRFYFNGVSGVTNALGLRNGDVETPKPEGVVRVLVLGDENVFGPGLRERDTLPRRLEAILKEQGEGKEVEVINAGVPFYNLQRSTGLLMPLVKKYQPDLAILLISEDDFNIQSFHPLGRQPATAPAPGERPKGKLPALGRLMLPEGKKAPLRYLLARVSRAYLCAAIFFKGSLQDARAPGPVLPDGYNPNIGLRRLDMAQSASCQSRRIIWTPLEHIINHIQELQSENSFQFAAVLYSDFSLRGRAGIRLLDTFEKTGAPLLNLSVYRKSEKTERREHTVSWGPWPNAASTARDAGLMASFIIDMGLLPDQYTWKMLPTGERPYDELIRVRKSMYWDKVNEQEILDMVDRKEFTSAVDFSKPASFSPKQLQYGWWPMERTAWLEFPNTVWASEEGVVSLAVPDNVSYLHFEGHLLKAISAFGPTEFGVTFECMPSNTVYRASGDTFDFQIPVPRELSNFKFLEVSFIAHNVFSPADMELRADDDGLLSMGITRIELK